MHYTILVFSCPYICFGTPCAILRGVVDSSRLPNTSRSLSQHKFTVTEYHLASCSWRSACRLSVTVNLCCESELDAFDNRELQTTPLRMAQGVPKHMQGQEHTKIVQCICWNIIITYQKARYIYIYIKYVQLVHLLSSRLQTDTCSQGHFAWKISRSHIYWANKLLEERSVQRNISLISCREGLFMEMTVEERQRC